MNEAIFVCKLNFEQFCGTRLLAAQPAFINSCLEILIGILFPKKNKDTDKENDTSHWIITQRQQEWGHEL